MHEPAAWVVGEFGTERGEVLAVPVDDGLEGVDHVEGSDARVVQGGACGVAESESADHDVDRVVGDGIEAESSEGFLSVGEQARHEPVAAEHHLEHVDLSCWFQPSAKDDIAHWCGRPGELFVRPAHVAAVARSVAMVMRLVAVL